MVNEESKSAAADTFENRLAEIEKSIIEMSRNFLNESIEAQRECLIMIRELTADIDLSDFDNTIKSCSEISKSISILRQYTISTKDLTVKIKKLEEGYNPDSLIKRLNKGIKIKTSNRPPVKFRKVSPKDAQTVTN